jgi:hypothetical protein
MQGKVELAEALGTTGAVRRVEGGKLEGESCWKSGGDERVFIAGRGSGWQMKPAQTPYRTRRAAKPHGVIHRSIFHLKAILASRILTLDSPTMNLRCDEDQSS